MARIRSIKPEFWTSDQITECSLNARLLFIGMWNFCDDAGRHIASLKRLKMEVFPGDSIKLEQIEQWMLELRKQGLVMEYSTQDVTCWQVTGWHHQKINRPQPTKYPPPPDGFSDDSLNAQGPLIPDRIGRDRKRKGKDTTFDQWWELWPRKVQKAAARKAYEKAIKSVSPDVLLEHVRAIRKTTKAQGEFCPYPATYLNQGRWEDDLSEWEDKDEIVRSLSIDEYTRNKAARAARTRQTLAAAEGEHTPEGLGDWRGQLRPSDNGEGED